MASTATAPDGTFQVSEKAARDLVKRAKRDRQLAFNVFSPFRCKLCDKPVPPVEQVKHLRGHERELDGIDKRRRQENAKQKEAEKRLRKENQMATTAKPSAKKRTGKASGATPATDLHKQVKKVSTRDAIVRVLKNARGPLAHKVLIERVVKIKDVPEKTIRGELSRWASEKDGTVVRVEKGVYDLRERTTTMGRKRTNKKATAKAVPAAAATTKVQA